MSMVCGSRRLDSNYQKTEVYLKDSTEYNQPNHTVLLFNDLLFVKMNKIDACISISCFPQIYILELL